MLKSIIIILILFPLISFGQKIPEDYSIYSNYLKIHQQQKSEKINYIIRESADYGKGSSESDISGMLAEFRNYLKGDKGAESIFFRCEFFRDTLTKDTLWLPLIAQLSHCMRKRYFVNDKFSKGLQVSILADQDYRDYFENNATADGWTAFHEDYPGYSLLTELSKIAKDEKRAVFYCSTRCGALCGLGQLVLFYKDDSGWRFVGALSIWMS